LDVQQDDVLDGATNVPMNVYIAITGMRNSDGDNEVVLGQLGMRAPEEGARMCATASSHAQVLDDKITFGKFKKY
jgi:hypothetical protein